MLIDALLDNIPATDLFNEACDLNMNINMNMNNVSTNNNHVDNHIDFELPNEYFTLEGLDSYKNIKDNIYPNKKSPHVDVESYVNCFCNRINGCDSSCQNKVLYM